MKIGVQLYNFRDALAQDFKGTLKEIAKIGFDGVEFVVNFGPDGPEGIAAYMKELGMECAGAMYREEDLLTGYNQAYEYAKALNTPAVTVSIQEDFIQKYTSLLARFRALGEAAKKHGCVFSYHNHWWEWVTKDGKSALEGLLDESDPESVFLEPDVCWIFRGGKNASEIIRKYANRIRQIHMKDIRVADDPQTTTPLGTGIIDIAGAFAAAKSAGAGWCIYEQDFSKDPFRDAAESLKKLRSL